jgi:dTDP-4-dehydrorhamnose reductase
MNFYKDKIIFTGGSGRFGKLFKNKYNFKNIIYPSRKQMDIENYKSVKNFLTKSKPKIIIHTAALSRPMNLHEKNPEKSIKANIVGTSNLVIAAINLNIKIIYFSTNYVYPLNNKSNEEKDPVMPINKYALSKMGGECAVQMYNNSLILRIIMSERPFMYSQAYSDIRANFLYHDEVIKIIPKIINLNGIYNLGGKIQSIYEFAKKTRNDVKKISAKKILKKKYYKNQIISIKKIQSKIKFL